MTARRLALPGAVALALLALPSAPASAHTELTGSSPGDGTKIAAPARVSLEFSGNVRPDLAKVQIKSDNGETWERGKPKVTANKVVQALMPGLPTGAYTIGYRVVSEDGHPVTGSLTFTVIGEATAAAASPSATPVAAPTQTVASEGGAKRWAMVGGGIAAGAGIGMVFSMRRKRG